MDVFQYAWVHKERSDGLQVLATRWATVLFGLMALVFAAVFIAALIAQAIILVVHFSEIEIAFLWYNLIAPAIVVVLAVALQSVLGSRQY